MKKLLFILIICTLCRHLIAEESDSSLISPAQLQEDFKQLYADLKESHIDLFVNVNEEAYNAEFDNINQKLNTPLTKLQAHILFQKFVAFGKIAHANIGFPNDAYHVFRDSGGKAFPLYVEINGSQWFVAEDYSSLSLQKGTEITHINALPVSSWLSTLHQYIAADTPSIASSLLEFQLPQYLWLMDMKAGAEEVQDNATLTVVLDNQATTLNINYLSRDALQERIDAQQTESSSESSTLRDHRILPEKVGYLKPGPFYNAENPADIWNNENFVTFINAAFEAFLDNDVTTLLIDVRNNPGGTNSFSDPLISWFADKPFKFASSFLIRSSRRAKESNQRRLQTSIGDTNSVSHQLAKAYEQNEYGIVFEFDIEEALPREGKRYNGNIIVLMDRTSYSNALSLAAIVQDYSFGTVVGENSADFATTYASIETFSLKHTGIEVGFPKAHIIRPSGDKKAGPVIPDIYIDNIELDTVVAIVQSAIEDN